MKKISVTAALLATVIAIPAAAQSVSGSVVINGLVAPKCLVVSPGAAASTFNTVVSLGDLANADGTMRTDLATAFSAAGNASNGLTAKVVCTTSTPTIAISATPLATGGTPAAGYDNSIDYTANIAVTTVGGTNPFSATTTTPLVATSVGGRLATGADNILVTASGFATNNPTDVLVSGAYTGTISFTIAPGA